MIILCPICKVEMLETEGNRDGKRYNYWCPKCNHVSYTKNTGRGKE